MEQIVGGLSALGPIWAKFGLCANVIALAAALLLGPAAFAASAAPVPVPGAANLPESALPAPRAQGPVSLEKALTQRRSQRSFGATPLTAAEAGQLTGLVR